MGLGALNSWLLLGRAIKPRLVLHDFAACNFPVPDTGSRFRAGYRVKIKGRLGEDWVWIGSGSI